MGFGLRDATRALLPIRRHVKYLHSISAKSVVPSPFPKWTGPSLRNLNCADVLLLTLLERRCLAVTSISFSIGLVTGDASSWVGETGSFAPETDGDVGVSEVGDTG